LVVSPPVDVEAEAGSKRRRGEPDPEEHVAPVTLDLISCLPDEMLGFIISLIRTKSAMLATFLSKCWRHL
jgi:hypothetical protein